jgi:tRNA A-37 threonylcarbamoyl transferase component Bud32
MEASQNDELEFLIRYGSREPDDADPILATHDRHTAYSSVQSHYKDLGMSGLLIASMVLALIVYVIHPLLLSLFAACSLNISYVFSTEIWIFNLVVWTYVVKTWNRMHPEGLFAPTDIGISESCLRLRKRSYLFNFVRKTMRWDDIISIDIDTDRTSFPSKLAATRPHLRIVDRHNQTVNLSIGGIRSIEERRLLATILKRKAPRAIAGKDIGRLVRIGQVNDIPFTKLWSNALTSSAKRCNTKPLPAMALLQEGHFRIKEQIGGGGQGAVYSASMLEGAEPEREVVLKEYVLPERDHSLERKRAIESFEREVWALAKFRHEGIVTLFDAFVEDHRAYLVLESLNGVSLKKYVVENGPISQALVCKLGMQMCEILSYLHQSQPRVLHLDFSPENLILDDAGKVTLIDFNTCSDGNFPKKTVIGKQRYMSPEQYRGKPSTSSDIYSLGATLFYLLTSKEPEPITVSQPSKFCSLDSELDNLVIKATALEEEDRFSNAVAVKQMLIEIENNCASEPSGRS